MSCECNVFYKPEIVLGWLVLGFAVVLKYPWTVRFLMFSSKMLVLLQPYFQHLYLFY